MKKRIITIALALTMTATIFSGCSQDANNNDTKQTSEISTEQTSENSTEPIDEIDIAKVKEDIISECGLKDMRDATKDEVSFLFDFGDAEYEDIVLSISQNSVSADQITIVKAKSEDDTNDIKKAIEDQLASRKSTFDGYAPDEVEKYENSEVKISGKYVYAAVCSDNKKAEKIFDNAFKD